MKPRLLAASPRGLNITPVYTKDGKSYTRQGTGREFIWDYDGLVSRIHGISTGLPIPAAQFETMIATCRELEREAKADKLIQLTLKQ